MASPSDNDPEFVGRLSLSITRLARVLRQQESSRLTPAAAAMLASIVRDGPISLGDLAAAERISPSTVTKLVAKLHSDGLIERDVDPSDRRVHRVRLSAEGRRHIESYRFKRNAWLAQQLDLLDEADRAHLRDALSVLERFTASEGGDPLSQIPVPEPPPGGG